MLARKQRALNFSGAIEALLMRRGNRDRNRRRPRLIVDLGRGWLMASRKRECCQARRQHEPKPKL